MPNSEEHVNPFAQFPLGGGERYFCVASNQGARPCAFNSMSSAKISSVFSSETGQPWRALGEHQSCNALFQWR